MTLDQLLGRLAWAGIGGFAAIVAALLFVRIRVLHPAIKVWLCRAAMLKLPLGLAAALVVTRAETTGPYLTTPFLIQYLALMWLAGVAVVATYGIRAYRAAARLVKLSQPLSDDESRQLIDSPARMRIRCVSGLEEPCIVGIWRPILIMPKGSRPSESMLRHELAHIAHGDAIFGLVGWVVQSLFWFVPGISRLLAEHSLWQEAWADASSRESLRLEPRAQATELLNAIAKGNSAPQVALGFRGEAKTVSRRIEAMFVSRHSAIAAGVVILLVAALLVPVRLEARATPGVTLYAPVGRMIR